MRIHYVVNARMPTEKAHGFQIAKMCEAFISQGAHVTLYVPQRKNDQEGSLKQYYGLQSDVSTEYLATLDLLPLGRIGFLVQELTFAVSALFRLRFKTSEIVYCRDIFIAALFSLFGNRVVYEDHEPRSKFWYKHLLRIIPLKIIVARNIADLYTSLGIDEDSYIIAPNGVDLKQFNEVAPEREIWKTTFGIDPDSKVVLYAGHFYKWKGVYTLLDAAQKLDTSIRVVFIGGLPEDHKKVSAYIKERGIENVYLHEFVSHSEIISYLKSADVLVLPNTAKEERSNRYTTPIKLFEYMASQVPIVASDIESFRPYLTDGVNAYLTRPDDPESLARAIDRALLGEGAQTARLAYTNAAQYKWQERARNILDFISGK